MAITNDFFSALNDPKAAMWSAGVAFNRSNPLPLDKWSVFQTMDEAIAYAESNAVAYPGQIIAVYDDGEMLACVLTEVEGKLVPEAIGVVPESDGVTIEVVDGELRLVGFADAEAGAQLVKGTDGKLSWVVPSTETVEGLQTTVASLQKDITAIKNELNPVDEEGNPVQGGIVSDVSDLQESVGNEAVYDEDGELVSEATGIYKDIEDIEDKIGSAAEYDDEGSLTAAATGLYVELDKKADIEEVNVALDEKVDASVVEEAFEEVNTELAKKADAETVTTELAKKADADSVYTIEEADDAIESAIAAAIVDADHLKREIVEKLEDINPAAEGADKIIYMVPTGLQADDDKYDEYMVINGFVEKVGSWEVDLSAYAKTADVNNSLSLKANSADVEAALADKVDVDDNARLMTLAEGEKLANIAEGAEVNVINSVDAAEFTVDQHSLSVKAISADKVTGLNDALQNINNSLANKVEADENARLMTNAEGEKLKGIAEGAEANVINSTNSEFVVTEGRELQVNVISKDKISGLNADLANINTALSTKVEQIEGYRLISTDEGTKLSALVVEEDGSVAISGTVGAGKVQELYDNVVRIVTGTGKSTYDGSEKDLLGIAAGAEVNVINSVSEEFTIDENRKLSVNIIDSSKISNLAANAEFKKVAEEAAKNTADIVTINTAVSANASDILTIRTDLNNYMLKTDADIADLKQILTWKDI